MPDVRLVDLDVIKRYSLAIRQESAPADEVLAVLDATRQQVVAAMAPSPPASPSPKAAKAANTGKAAASPSRRNRPPAAGKGP